MKAIHTLSLEELERWMRDNGYPAYRAGQLYDWLWRHPAESWEEMRNLPLQLREALARDFRMERIPVSDMQESADGSVKYVLRLEDGREVETVLIPSGGRSTVCVSSQVGCPLGCAFCATARMGFVRNLDIYEMFAQVLLARRESERRFGHPLGNLVWMGMGEPLLNFDALAGAVGRVTAPDGLAMSPSRITISTSGVTGGIIRLARTLPAVNLAVSLHSADDRQRGELMPVARRYPLPALSDALAEYHRITRQRITIEYMLLKGINDSQRHADLLLNFCRRFPVRINVIEYNPHPQAPFLPSDRVVEAAFVRRLEGCNLAVSVRRSKGRDIAAACGQLANAKKKSE